MTEVPIDKVIVAAAIEVRRELGGPGLIEDIEFNAKTQRRRDALRRGGRRTANDHDRL